MNKSQEEIQAAVAYGIGYACGKHDLKMTKKEVNDVSKKYSKQAQKSIDLNKEKIVIPGWIDEHNRKV